MPVSLFLFESRHFSFFAHCGSAQKSISIIDFIERPMQQSHELVFRFSRVKYRRRDDHSDEAKQQTDFHYENGKFRGKNVHDPRLKVICNANFLITELILLLVVSRN